MPAQPEVVIEQRVDAALHPVIVGPGPLREQRLQVPGPYLPLRWRIPQLNKRILQVGRATGPGTAREARAGRQRAGREQVARVVKRADIREIVVAAVMMVE